MFDMPLLLHRVVNQMERTADRVLRKELGHSHRRIIVLLVLEQEGAINQRELAALLGHTEPAISAMMRELSAEGLVSAEAADGRQRRVSIAESGSRLVAAARAVMTPMFDRVVAQSGADAQALGSQLQRLTVGMGVAG